MSVFHLTTDDDFGRYRVASRSLETFDDNVGTSRRYGVETARGYYPNAKLAFRAAYTHSDFLSTNVQFLLDHFTDKVMPDGPRHRLAPDAEYAVGLHRVIGVNAFGQSMQYADHRNQVTAGRLGTAKWGLAGT